MLQVSTWHVAPAHVAVALARLHAAPHAPQLAVLVARLVSQPLPATPSQSPNEALHRMTVQAPLAHPLADVLGSAQARPHEPQLDGSMDVLAQNCDGAVPHVASGAPQDAVHAPCEHTWPAAQAMPQAPQLPLSVCALTSQPSAAEWLQSA